MTDLQNRVIKRSREKISRFTKNKYNPKHHPKIQKDRLQAVLEKFGQVGEIYVWQSERNGGDWTIFDGHARQELDADQEWDIAWTSLTDPEVDELVLYYDPLAALAKQEADKTMALMAGLKVQERELKEMLQEQAQALGFTFGGNGGDTANEDEVVIDRAEELQGKWGVVAGDVWEIGRHRLVCGDSQDKTILDLAIRDRCPLLTLADPPYGISVVKGLRAAVGGSKPVTIGAVRGRRPYPFGGVKHMRGADGATHMVDATLYRPVHGDDEPFDPRPLLELSEHAIIWGGNYHASKLPNSRCWIVWDKDNTGNFADAELAWTSFDRGVKLYKFTWNGLVREGKREIEGVKRFHPTQKPVGLFVKILEDFVLDRAVVIDPYLGSGTTLLACELTGNIGIGIDIDAAYCSVTLERLQTLGLEPKRVGQA